MAGQVDDGPSPSTVIAQHTFVDDVPNTEDFLECLNIWWQKPNILLKKCAGAKTTHTEQNYNNRRFVPKRSYNSCSETQVVLSDCDSDRITVRFQPNHDGCAAPIPQMCALPVLQPYEFCFDSDSRCMSLSCKEGSNERSQQFLVSVLFPRVVAWLVAGCRDKGSRRGPRLVAKSLQQVDIETYARTYQRLKKKYADAVKEMWCEKTNPEKFIHEDIGIASYLMTYWSSYRQPKCFVDLGCGNGLLVYLLSSEGYHGYGIDVRRRAIWDKLNVTLREVSLDPSTATLNDADFLIGNHSDELTPWIAVLAARSSEMCEYFVLPCCAHDFYGKFHRKNSNFSVFRDYLDYVQNVGEKFGFRLLADSLRIPSTKRICFTAVRLARKVCTEDEMRAAIMALTENRAQHSGFVTRPAVEPVRNCTALPRLRIDEMVQAIAAELVSRSPSAEDGWRAGGRLLLKECVALLSAEQRTLLRQQCGGVKTLLRNHKHIFAVDARACTATLRDYRTEQIILMVALLIPVPVTFYIQVNRMRSPSRMAPLDLVTETATASTEELPEPSCPRDAGEIDRGQRMLVEGRALRLKSANASEMNNAVELLSQSCELLAKQCGQLALEVAPSYLEYGTALLDLERLTGGPEAFLSAVKEAVSQQTANMLAGAEGNDEMTEKEGEAAGKEEGKEEKQESQTSKEADVEKATSGEPAESGTATEAKEEEAEEKKEETTAEEQKEEEGAEGEGEEGEDEEEGEEGGEEMDSAAEDEDNLGLSWEMVDLARTIYEKEGMVADEVRCRLLLAEVATENDDFERAQGELAAVLANGATKPRQRAEAFYLRGVGEGLKNEYKTATVSFGEAIKAVEQCIELEKSDDEKKVLAELKADMAKRLAEVQEDCKEQLPKEIIAERLGGDHGNEFDAGKLDVQATDSVTHLVRKKEKRAVEEGAEGEAKRAKVDEAAE